MYRNATQRNACKMQTVQSGEAQNTRVRQAYAAQSSVANVLSIFLTHDLSAWYAHGPLCLQRPRNAAEMRA